MTKTRRSRHRVPTIVVRPEPISERYRTEVEYSTNRLQRRYERALKARDAACKRLARASEGKTKSSRLAELRRQVDIREHELAEIEKLMQPSGRQRVPWRPVPVTSRSL